MTLKPLVCMKCKEPNIAQTQLETCWVTYQLTLNTKTNMITEAPEQKLELYKPKVLEESEGPFCGSCGFTYYDDADWEALLEYNNEQHLIQELANLKDDYKR